MSTSIAPVTPPVQTVDADRATKISAGFGLAYALCQLIVMIGFSVLVLPKGGSTGEDPLHWGNDVLGAAAWH